MERGRRGLLRSGTGCLWIEDSWGVYGWRGMWRTCGCHVGMTRLNDLREVANPAKMQSPYSPVEKGISLDDTSYLRL